MQTTYTVHDEHVWLAVELSHLASWLPVL